MNKPLIVTILIIGFVGYIIGAKYGNKTMIGGLDSVSQEKLEKVEKMFPPIPDSNFVTGSVVSLDGQVITLNTPPVNPLDESPQTRKVTVTDNTKIIKREMKSSETIKKEQDAYQKKVSTRKSGSADPLPISPEPFVEKELAVLDLMVGDHLNIEAATQIRMLEKFEAVKIIVEFSAADSPSPTITPLSVPALHTSTTTQ